MRPIPFPLQPSSLEVKRVQHHPRHLVAQAKFPGASLDSSVFRVVVSGARFGNVSRALPYDELPNRESEIRVFEVRW